jgi:hypothetical protein
MTEPCRTGLYPSRSLALRRAADLLGAPRATPRHAHALAVLKRRRARGTQIAMISKHQAIMAGTG